MLLGLGIETGIVAECLCMYGLRVILIGWKYDLRRRGWMSMTLYSWGGGGLVLPNPVPVFPITAAVSQMVRTSNNGSYFQKWLKSCALNQP